MSYGLYPDYLSSVFPYFLRQLDRGDSGRNIEKIALAETLWSGNTALKIIIGFLITDFSLSKISCEISCLSSPGTNMYAVRVLFTCTHGCAYTRMSCVLASGRVTDKTLAQFLFAVPGEKLRFQTDEWWCLYDDKNGTRNPSLKGPEEQKKTLWSASHMVESGKAVGESDWELGLIAVFHFRMSAPYF